MTKMSALLKNTFLRKCFDISNTIFNYNQTIDKVSYSNLKPITINVTSNIALEILQTGFHVKKPLISNSLWSLFFVTGV